MPIVVPNQGTVRSVRGFGYTVYRGLLNWVYGIFMMKFGY